jgi:ankyrin repeat protein
LDTRKKRQTKLDYFYIFLHFYPKQQFTDMPVDLDEDVGEELLDACVSGDFEQAQWILKNDGNFANWSESEQNVSILHTVAYHDLLDACRLLLSYGADPNRMNNNGETPLFWAVRMNCFQIAMTLLEHGADANCLDNSGSTALHYACCHAVPELIPLLLSYRCDPEIKDVDGKTALESIEREMDEDYFACTVLIRRHMKGMKNSCLTYGVSNDPSFVTVDNVNAFDVISTGSRVANEPAKPPNKKKFQVPRSYSPHKNVLKKPGFIAGSKTYYLHTPNSYTQKMHQDVSKKLLSVTGGLRGQHTDNEAEEGHPELRTSHSAPGTDWAKFKNNHNNSPVAHMAKAPIMEESLHRSFCSLTNDDEEDYRKAGEQEESSMTGNHNPNTNKFLALESSTVRNRLRLFQPKNQGQFFAMPFVPDNAVTERFDVVISVEHCANCHLHGASVRHDKKKYATIADECLRKVIVDVMKHCGQLRVIALKAESKSSRIGALEVSVAIFLPSQNKNTSKESWEWKCKSIHSKLASKRYVCAA